MPCLTNKGIIEGFFSSSSASVANMSTILPERSKLVAITLYMLCLFVFNNSSFVKSTSISFLLMYKYANISL